jgi:hypothetical protein
MAAILDGSILLDAVAAMGRLPSVPERVMP